MKNTLKENKDFRRLYGRGKRYVGPALVTYVMRNRAGYCRIGITASKKTFRHAVERNRVRRIIRAAFYECSREITCGYDIVFVARSRTLELKSCDMAAIMKRHLSALGCLVEKNEKNSD